jgi:ketosteroid isomerase-like protein
LAFGSHNSPFAHWAELTAGVAIVTVAIDAAATMTTSARRPTNFLNAGLPSWRIPHRTEPGRTGQDRPVRLSRHRSSATTVNSVTTPTAYPTDEADIRRRIDQLAGAIRATDLEAVMSAYTTDVVSFDIEPPLQHVGAQAKRKNWERVFTVYEHPLGYEIRDLTITVGDDVAFAHSLNRLSGTLKSGTTTTGFWIRASMCFVKVNGDWFVSHDHASAPLDVTTGAALLNLEP